MASLERPTLGGFMSAECFRYLRVFGEEAAGRSFIVYAGKQRGISLQDALKGLTADNTAEVIEKLNGLLGEKGTHLCVVEQFESTADGYRFKVSESACSFGMHTTEPNCAYTMGVFLGITETITARRFTVSESECVAMGHAHCIYNLQQL
jgi:predicted hydrocarbon binding protein